MLTAGLMVGYVVLSRVDGSWSIPLTVVCMMSCSFFVQAACGAVFAVVPLVRRQLQLGQINYAGLLNTQQIYQQARLNLVQAQATRYADTVALFQALGGGWWNRTETQAAQAAITTRD